MKIDFQGRGVLRKGIENPRRCSPPFDVKVIGKEFSGKRPHHVVNPEVLEGSA